MRSSAMFVVLAFSALVTTSLFAQKDIETLRIDKNHSTIGFEVPIMGNLSKVTGKFTEFETQIVWNEDDLSKSSISATIQVISVDTGIDERDHDLLGPAFFHAAKYPTITFESDEITNNGVGYVAHGILTMRGVSKKIALPFKWVKRENNDGGFFSAFNIEYELNRTEFGITWQHNLLKFFVGDQVTVKLFLLIRS